MRLLLVLALLAALAVVPSSATAQSAPGQTAVAAKKAKKKQAKRSRCARHRSRSARKRCVRVARCLRRARGSRRARKRCLTETRKRKSSERSPSSPGSGGGSAPRRTGGGGGTTTPGGGEETGPTLGRYVSVAAREFSLTLSRPALAAGSVTVELRNAGEDPHNLVLSPDDGSHDVVSSFEETGPGELRAKNLSLPAGSYYMWCSLPAHELLGMHARLQVR